MGGVGERLRRWVAGITPVGAAEALLVTLLAVQAARLFWALLVPLGPVGDWKPPSAVAVQADPAFDPFFRLGGASDNGAVTSLALKLFGVRVDEATGRSSAIVATPDGVQSSFGVGEEVMPGVRLKAVTIDHVTLDRGGVEEQLYLDESVPAPVAAVPSTVTPPASYDAPPPATLTLPLPPQAPK